jgi:hypothetical protein
MHSTKHINLCLHIYVIVEGMMFFRNVSSFFKLCGVSSKETVIHTVKAIRTSDVVQYSYVYLWVISYTEIHFVGSVLRKERWTDIYYVRNYILRKKLVADVIRDNQVLNWSNYSSSTPRQVFTICTFRSREDKSLYLINISMFETGGEQSDWLKDLSTNTHQKLNVTYRSIWVIGSATGMDGLSALSATEPTYLEQRDPPIWFRKIILHSCWVLAVLNLHILMSKN